VNQLQNSQRLFALIRGDHGFKICQQEWLKAQPDIVICVITMVRVSLEAHGAEFNSVSGQPHRVGGS
jgi:hypothetical protein